MWSMTLMWRCLLTSAEEQVRKIVGSGRKKGSVRSWHTAEINEVRGCPDVSMGKE
jgi:hypothetical protein